MYVKMDICCTKQTSAWKEQPVGGYNIVNCETLDFPAR